MATATFRISYTVGGREYGVPTQAISFDVQMVYNYIAANTWSSSARRLGVQSGEWTSTSPTSKTVDFYDDKGKHLATLRDVPLTTSYGYPFNGLTGKTGRGSMAGGIGPSGLIWVKWEIISV